VGEARGWKQKAIRWEPKVLTQSSDQPIEVYRSHIEKEMTKWTNFSVWQQEVCFS
jgi:hypothetical protein